MKTLLTTAEFASLAGMSERRARKICQEIEGGHRFHWDSAAIEIKVFHGRPGRSGKNYFIKVSSLPPYLQERLRGLQTPAEKRLPPLSGTDAARERTWWLHITGPIIEHPKGTAERHAAYVEAASKPVLDWNGRRIRLTIRTLQRRVARMEGEGSIGPLARSGRADKGQKRVFVCQSARKVDPGSASNIDPLVGTNGERPTG